MAGYLIARSWTFRLAPLFMHKPLLAGLLVGACISCGDERPDNASLLAKVGEVEITATDLRTFEDNLKDGHHALAAPGQPCRRSLTARYCFWRPTSGAYSATKRS